MKGLHLNIKLRIFMLLFQRGTSHMILPFMAIYYAYHFGVTIAGILSLLVALSGIVASFYGGYFADLFGRKKVMIQTEQLRFLAFAAMAMVNSPWLVSPSLTIIFSMIIQVCFGLSAPAYESMIIDVCPPEKRKSVYTLTYWVNSLSVAIGTALGAFFYEKYFFQLLCVTALAAIITWLLMKLFLVETKQKVDGTTTNRISMINIFSSYKDIFLDRTFLKYFLATLLMFGLEFQLGGYIAIRLSEEFDIQQLFHISVTGVEMYGVLRTENTLLVILLAAVVARCMKRFSDRFSLYSGVILMTLGFMVLGMSNHSWLLLSAILIVTIGELMFVPIKKVLVADLAKEELRSRYMAMDGLTFRGGLLLGSLGITIGTFLPAWGMSLLIGLMGTTSILLYRSIYRNFKGEEQKKKLIQPISPKGA